MLRFFFAVFALFCSAPASAQEVISLTDIGGLHAAYVVPRDDLDRIDVQLIVLSGTYDDPEVSGTAHFTEHLAAFSADATVLRQPRERDLFAKTTPVSSIYTNYGPPSDFDRVMKLSRALLDTPDLPPFFAQSEIKIVQRETLLRERQSPTRWLRRKAQQNLYGATRGRANDVVADLPDLNLQTALAFHKVHYVASNITLIISGNINVADAAAAVTKYFGDTQKTVPPAKDWLNAKPEPTLRAKETLVSDKLANDMLLYTKFIDPADKEDSFDMQGAFFIGTTIYESRIRKALFFESFDYMTFDISSYLAKNGDQEVTVLLEPMPHVDLQTASQTLETVIADLLKTSLSAEEIEEARKRNIVNAQAAARRPTSFLRFLENVASDGFPPISPGTYAQLLAETSDAEVIEFLQDFVAPAATSQIFARKAD